MMTKKIASGKRTLLQRGMRASVQLLAACGFIAGVGMMQSCEKDVLTGQPEWLGNSIYERLKEGIEVDGQKKSFNTTIRLIDDLGYTEVLAKTGSKTLFVASDDDYAAWFAKNTWGVTKYEDLTDFQKKQLFNSTMINDAYLVELMSNVSGNPPKEGLAMRRNSAADINDYVPRMAVADMPYNADKYKDPVNTAWAKFRNSGSGKDSIWIYRDASSAPMIHFLPSFMRNNHITDEDLKIISNGASQSIGDSWVNGKKIISDELTCKNGYIYVVDGVMELNKSMMDIINEQPDLTLWASNLRRWAVPAEVSRDQLRQFQRIYNTTDTVYNLRYLNKSTNHNYATPTGNEDDNINSEGLLLFDPAWNQYISPDNHINMNYDAGVMIVPTDSALNAWFSETGKGHELAAKFATWDSIPLTTLVQLMNVNMQQSFIAAVPSKFETVYNDIQRPLGIKPGDIKRCYMGCNGIVYVVKEVYEPAEFSSVVYPINVEGEDTFGAIYHALTGSYFKDALIDANFDVSRWDFRPYLKAMDARFSVFVPYNKQTSLNATTAAKNQMLFRMLSPCTPGEDNVDNQVLLEIWYDAEKGNIDGYKYNCKVASDGSVTLVGAATARTTLVPTTSTNKNIQYDQATSILYDYINNCIILDDINEDKQEYYKTKAGSIVRVFREDGKLYIQGGFQMEHGTKVEIENHFTKTNGTTYGLDNITDPSIIDLPMPSQKTVYQILKEEKDKGGDHLFFDLLFDDASGTDPVDGVSKVLFANKQGSYYCPQSKKNYNISVFDNYNYTVYIPSDEKIQAMIDNGYLPTWNDYSKASSNDEKIFIAERIHDFLRYHIQDNSVCVKGAEIVDSDNPSKGQLFESAKMNPVNKRFYSVEVRVKDGEMTVKDQVHPEARTINIASGFYNKTAREPWISGTEPTAANPRTGVLTLASTSHAVLHKISDVLLFDKSQESRWQTEFSNWMSSKK